MIKSLGFCLTAAVAMITIRPAFADIGGLHLDPTDLLTLLGFGSVTTLITLSIISFVASLICALTPTPSPDSIWGRIYQVIEWLAMVTKSTKETGIPVVDALHKAQIALLTSRVVHTALPAQDGIAITDTKGVGRPGSAIAPVVGLFALFALVGLSLSACGGAPASPATGTVIASPSGHSLVGDTASLASKVGGVVTAINSGISASGDDVKLVCGGLSYLHAFYAVVAPLAGASAADNAMESVAMDGVEALCSGPPPSNVGEAAVKAVAAYKTVSAALKNVDPGAAASAGVSAVGS